MAQAVGKITSLDVLYLFRQFESEAIRILMPVDTINSSQQLPSFLAALHLGLKLLILVLEKALAVLVSCSCEDGCYECVFAYRNNFEQDNTSRRSAIAVLNAIITRKDKITLSQPGLSEVKLNALI